MSTTWVRAQDEFGQFDVRKGDELREGVSLVEDYPEHEAELARDGKPFTSKDGKKATKTSDAKSSGTGEETKTTGASTPGAESE